MLGWLAHRWDFPILLFVYLTIGLATCVLAPKLDPPEPKLASCRRPPLRSRLATAGVRLKSLELLAQKDYLKMVQEVNQNEVLCLHRSLLYSYQLWLYLCPTNKVELLVIYSMDLP